MAEAVKRCSKCGEVKALECFARRSQERGGKPQPHCKACEVLRVQAWRLANLDKERARQAEYRRQHQRERRLNDKKWKDAHPERHRQLQRQHQAKRRANLSDDYIRRTLAQKDGPPNPPAALIQLKREQLSLRRLTRELVQELEKHDGN